MKTKNLNTKAFPKKLHNSMCIHTQNDDDFDEILKTRTNKEFSRIKKEVDFMIKYGHIINKNK